MLRIGLAFAGVLDVAEAAIDLPTDPSRNHMRWE
jgi:hypothetical protein